MHLILGASGQLGSRVARRLLDAGEPVRAVSRDPQRLEALAARGAEVLQGDLLERDWMPAALNGVRSVVLAAHGLLPPSRKNHPAAVDGIGTRHLLDQAARSGVERVVHVSAAGGKGPNTSFMKVKRETEGHLRASGLPHTILRPTVFMENHALVLMGEPLRDTGTVTLFGRGATPVNWISAADVADRVVEALGDMDAPDATLEIGGPQVRSRLEVLAILEEALGRTAKRRHAPVAVVRILRGIVGPFHPGMRHLLELVLEEETRPESVPLDPARFQWIGPTRVEEVVERWVRAHRSAP